jgi:DNA-binding beta-propeller fold protein YncE
MRRCKSLTRWLGVLAVMSSIVAEYADVGPIVPVLRRTAMADAPVRPGNSKRSRVIVEPTAFQQSRGPSLDGGVGWLNSAGPIRLEELRGKVVLLDFWTYCCINCHHVLPDLARLEAKYPNELVVIGVHTAKFFAERDTENIRRKVREYGIKHPVVNDADQVIWSRFNVESWPTLVLIDPTGDVLGAVSGEGHYALLDKLIGQLVAKHRAKGDLNSTPIRFFPEDEKPDNTPLLFPGKVTADLEGNRLFIADTAHNRIVITNLQGKSAKVVGSGIPGLVDGPPDKAAFHRPQGMCLAGQNLYVADTENHAIRAIDLKTMHVATVAGNGQQSHRHAGNGPGKSTPLNSPWDVIPQPGSHALLIAMAGPHQIWRYDIDSEIVGVWAGTGAENIVDGTLTTAAFAQPSGLAIDKEGAHLYVADSEVSGIRSITLDKRNHRVETIVGVGLFGFGDVDGLGEEVRLQHCLGIAYGGGKLFIADSYNNKIKVCDPRSRTVETLVGARQPGQGDNPARFYQPGGLSVAGSHLYVADTNNHAIRVVDLKEKTVRTLEIAGLTPPSPATRAPSFPNAQIIAVPAAKVAPSRSLTLDVNLPLAPEFKVNADAPMPYLVETSGAAGRLADEPPIGGGKISPPKRKFPVTISLATPLSAGDKFDLKFSVSAFVCNEGSNLCQVKSYIWTVPVRVAGDGEPQVVLPAVSPPQSP